MTREMNCTGRARNEKLSIYRHERNEISEARTQRPVKTGLHIYLWLIVAGIHSSEDGEGAGKEGGWGEKERELMWGEKERELMGGKGGRGGGGRACVFVDVFVCAYARA